jgi:hypothetical protein
MMLVERVLIHHWDGHAVQEVVDGVEVRAFSARRTSAITRPGLLSLAAQRIVVSAQWWRGDRAPGAHAFKSNAIITGDTAPARLREASAGGFHLLQEPVSPMALRTTLNRLLKAQEACSLPALQ